MMAPCTRPSTALPTTASMSGISAASWLSTPGRPSSSTKSGRVQLSSSVPLLTLPSRSKPGATPGGFTRVKASLVTMAGCDLPDVQDTGASYGDTAASSSPQAEKKGVARRAAKQSACFAFPWFVFTITPRSP